MLIGYARVSTSDQNLLSQKDALEKAGCERIYEDEQSGTKDNRTGLSKALEMLRENDTLVVWKLDRLGRSVKSLIERFFFHVMASLAQMERELIVERTKAGLESAKKLGRVGGRKRVMTDSRIFSAKKLLKSGVLPKDVAKDLGVSLATLYRWIPVNTL